MQSICEHKDLLKHIGIAQWYNSKLSCEVRFPTPSGHTFLCERNQQSPRACWKKQLRKKSSVRQSRWREGTRLFCRQILFFFRCQNVRKSLPGWLRLRSDEVCGRQRRGAELPCRGARRSPAVPPSASAAAGSQRCARPAPLGARCCPKALLWEAPSGRESALTPSPGGLAGVCGAEKLLLEL